MSHHGGRESRLPVQMCPLVKHAPGQPWASSWDALRGLTGFFWHLSEYRLLCALAFLCPWKPKSAYFSPTDTTSFIVPALSLLAFWSKCSCYGSMPNTDLSVYWMRDTFVLWKIRKGHFNERVWDKGLLYTISLWQYFTR